MKVCVIGAGVIGCATAYQLARRGHEVALVDSAAGPAAGASRGNGGQLSYRFIQPLASPGTLRSLPGLMLDRDSPVAVRLRPSLRQARWIAAFLACCRAGATRRGTHRLLAMTALSRLTLERWIADDGLDVGLRRNGKLVLCHHRGSLREQARQVALLDGLGDKQHVLDRDGCLAVEPVLRAHDGFVGGVWTPGECAVDPRAFCEALFAAAVARGARASWSTHVETLVVGNGKVVAATSRDGDIDADAFVLANGVAAPRLGRALGELLPIEPVKGYSLTLAMKPGEAQPKTNVTDLARKTVFAPGNGRLRIAAMAELGHRDLRIPRKRVEQIRDTVESVFPGLCDLDRPDAWAGLRPSTPSSVPIVRRSRIGNAFLNVGHGALGLTLACGSACLIAEAIDGMQGSASSCHSNRPPL